MTTPQWSGEMLDRPEMVQAFAAQLRRMLSENAAFVQAIRRDAEAMWDANPPEGYSSFERWWRAKWVKSPMGEIQEHLEDAAKLTFKLEARYRKGRHEIPAARLAARQKTQVGQPELGSGQFGRRTQQPRRPSTPPPDGGGGGVDFLDLVRGDRQGRSA